MFVGKRGFASAAVATDVWLYGLKGFRGLKGLAASAAWGTLFGHNLEQLDTTRFWREATEIKKGGCEDV